MAEAIRTIETKLDFRTGTATIGGITKSELEHGENSGSYKKGNTTDLPIQNTTV
jgi:hypothetical protein